ncbi:MAG TPA: hypothetical protein VHZ51_24595 [Ktedonobacteraceae bacterium]|nr:hypothetical protein [Ktedonobacteraceae bacterium]
MAQHSIYGRDYMGSVASGNAAHHYSGEVRGQADRGLGGDTTIVGAETFV